MRTTLEIDDDVYRAARDLARLKRQGIGKAVSDLARFGLSRTEDLEIEMKFGIPTLKKRPNAVPVTSELVRQLMEEE